MDADHVVRGEAVDVPTHRSGRWLVVVGFGIWAAGLALWEASWLWSLAASFGGGAALTIGLGYLSRGTPTSRPPVWGVSVPVAISLVLISQGVGQSEFAARVALVGFGSLGMIVVFLRILGERTAIERQLTQRTLADERRRLAGEVHDVVGHTLAASMLHLSAARLAIREDPDAAISSLQRAEEHGRRSMEDIGSVVRLLRADDSATSPPSPRLDELPALVEGFRSGGVDISYSAAAGLDDLPVTTALTVYRVVQEGLTNAVRHGIGNIDVDVDVVAARNRVEVRIGNDSLPKAGPITPGSGLAGMRERVTAIGGTLEAGAANGGHRWVLSATIPT